MALNFPDSPSLNQVYTDSVSGFSFKWDGIVWQSYTPAAAKNINIVDDFASSFNGSTQTFALAVSGTSLTPANAQQLIVVLGGIVQEPAVDYTVSGSNITFTTAPAAGLTLSIVSLGPAIPVYLVEDGTITPAKLSTGGPSWNTAGGLNVTGIATVNSLSIGSTQVISSARQLQNITSLDATTTATIESAVSAAPNDFSSLYVSGISTLGYSSGVGTVRIGSGSTTLIVEGNTRVTGILTVGTSSITLNGATDQINVGSGLTLSAGGIQVGVITATTVNATTVTGAVTGNATGLSGTPNINVGFITATSASFSGNVSIAGTLTYEDVTNIDSIGIVTARAGIVLGPTANTIRLGTGTTISSPASDTFTVLTGGSERVRVGSTGNLLVGTTSDTGTASQRLQVTGNAYVSTSVGIGTTNSNGIGGQASQLAMVGSNAGGGAGYHQFLAVSNTTATNPNKFFRLTSTGSIEIVNSAYTTALFSFANSGDFTATGDITAFLSSDIRLKKDIRPISEPIKKLMEISGVTYKWNEEYLKDKDVDGYFVRETEVGVIAQEVEKVLPEVVATRENGYKAVRYEKLVALLIEAVKDQQHQIDELKARLEEI